MCIELQEKIKNNGGLLKALVVILIMFTVFVIVSMFFPNNKSKGKMSQSVFLKSLDKSIPALMNYYSVPGLSIAVIHNGKVIFKNAYGYADIESRRKMHVDTICRVQSISKTVTACGVLKLVQEGKISLDTPVKNYLKNWEFPFSDSRHDKITARQLLSHTAGMPLGDFTLEFDPESFVPSLSANLSNEAHLINEPGTGFMYSNVGYNMLELLIEEVAGEKFSEFMKREVLDAIGMKSATYEWNNAVKQQIPTGYDLKSNPVKPYVYPEKGSGGLFSNVEDLSLFLIAGMYNNQNGINPILQPHVLKQMHHPAVRIPGIYGLVSQYYGFGYFIEHIHMNKAVFHGGQGHGWMTHFHSIPETGDGIVILTNSQRSWPLISNILDRWAKWTGYGSPGMTKILTGIKIIWTVAALLLLLSIWTSIGVARDLMFSGISFNPSLIFCFNWRFAKFVLSVILLATVAWFRSKQYSLVLAVFPVEGVWLGYSAFVFAVVLMISALFIRLHT